MGETRRFTKFTKKKKDAYLGSIERGCGKRVAASAAGISYQWIWEYKKEHPEFAAEELVASECAVEAVESSMWTMAQHHTTAGIFWLKNRAPDRWTDVYDDVLRARLIAEAKEQLAGVLTEAFTAEGIDADAIERIATAVRAS